MSNSIDSKQSFISNLTIKMGTQSNMILNLVARDTGPMIMPKETFNQKRKKKEQMVVPLPFKQEIVVMR